MMSSVRLLWSERHDKETVRTIFIEWGNVKKVMHFEWTWRNTICLALFIFSIYFCSESGLDRILYNKWTTGHKYRSFVII